jgi:hypothetical protein
MEKEGDMTDKMKAEDSDPISRATSGINSLGALATAVVGLCSTMFACSADNIKRNDAFVSAISAQEAQWQALYDQFFAAISVKDDAELRDKRLLSICQFSDRPIPDFSEHQLGYFWILDNQKRQKAAGAQLDKLKLGLRTALATEGVSSPKSVDCILNRQAEAVADQTKVRAREVVAEASNPGSVNGLAAASQPVVKVTKVELGETVNQVKTSRKILKKAQEMRRVPETTLTLTVGARDGYDIDVFWCEGPDAQNYRRKAELVSNLLSQDSRSKVRLNNQFAIGRIRLRPLSIENQLSGNYPATGLEVRGDDYEDKILHALTGRLNGDLGVGPFIPIVSNSDTKWYLSVFVCA